MKNLFSLLLVLAVQFGSIAQAELFLFTGEKPKVKTRSIDMSHVRSWYSYIALAMPSLSAGNCRSTKEIASLVLPSSEWLVRLDEIDDDDCISWSTIDDQWYSILESIDQQNQHMNIWINHSEKTIGWSTDKRAVAYVAHRIPLVWRLKANYSLKTNIERWADTINWQLVWQVSEDYPILADSTFYGEAFSKDGVVDQVIQKMSKKDAQSFSAYLVPRFDLANHIVAVYPARKELIK